MTMNIFVGATPIKAIINKLLVSHPLVQHKLMRAGGDY